MLRDPGDLSIDDLPSFPSERYSIDYSSIQICAERLKAVVNISSISRILSWEERPKQVTAPGGGVQEGLTIDNCLYSGYSSLSPSPLPSRQSSAKNVIQFVTSRLLEHSSETSRGGGWGCDSTAEKRICAMMKGAYGIPVVLDMFWWVYLKYFGLTLAASSTANFHDAVAVVRGVFESLKDGDGCISDEDFRRLLFRLGAIELEQKNSRDDSVPIRVSLADFEDLMLRRPMGEYAKEEVQDFIDRLFRRLSINLCSILFSVDLSTRDLVSNPLMETLFMCIQRAFFECFSSTDCRQRTSGNPFIGNVKKWILRSMTGVPVAETSTLKPEMQPYGAAIASSMIASKDTLHTTLSFSSPTATHAPSKRRLQTQDSFHSHVNRVRSFKQRNNEGHRKDEESGSNPTNKSIRFENTGMGRQSSRGLKHSASQKGLPQKKKKDTSLLDIGTFVQAQDEDDSDEGSTSGSRRIALSAASVRQSAEVQNTTKMPARVTALPTGSHFSRGGDSGLEDLIHEFKQLHRASRAKFQQVRKEIETENKDQTNDSRKPVFEQLSHYPRWFEGKNHRDAVRVTPKTTRWDVSSFSPCMQVYLNERGAHNTSILKPNSSQTTMEILDPDEPKVRHDYKKRADAIRERIKQLGGDEPSPDIMRDIKKREHECRKELQGECERLKKSIELEKSASKQQMDHDLAKIWKAVDELNAVIGGDDARIVNKLTATCNAIDTAMGDSRTSFALRNKLWNMTCKLKPRLDYLLRIQNWHERSLEIPDESCYANIDEEFDSIMKDMGNEAKRKQKERMTLLQKTAFLDPLESKTMLGEILKQNYRMYIESEKFCTEL